MRTAFGATTRVGRVLGAVLALAGLLRTPLPQPDFHNIRHHDAPGEVCEHHDHLLRWHPGAGLATDVAVLHWHWFLLRSDGGDPAPERQGQALHAHTPESPATFVRELVLVTSDTSSRLVGKRDLSSDLPAEILRPDAAGLSLPGEGHSVPPPGVAPPRALALNVLQQRWLC